MNNETTIIPKMEPSPMDLLRLATEQGADVDKLEKLMALQERWQANKARAAFFNAIGEFQSACPDLRKNKKVEFTTKSGGTTSYNYAPLADIDRQIKGLMKEHGLSKRWEFEDKPGELRVTCIVTHKDGHSERTTMTSPADPSGGKNDIQARGSSIEYMKRYTLIGALGLATADQDIDGRLPELDVDKLHKQYMEVFNQIIVIDPNMRALMDPDSWAERNAAMYVKAINRAREILIQKTKGKI